MSAGEELLEGQTAQPSTCGSCSFFRRHGGWGGGGACWIKLPPWVAMKLDDGKDEEGSPRSMNDTGGCDLWKRKDFGGRPVQFMQKQYWHAGEPRP